MSRRASHASFACALARRRLAERESGALGAERAEQLERHLEECAACRREQAFDRTLTAELAALRVEYPYAIDVRQRVLSALDARSRVPLALDDAVAPGQLGLAAAVAIAATIAVAVATGLGSEAIVGGARQLWEIAGVAADAALPMARAALELAAVPLRAALRFAAWLSSAAAPLADRWLPSALTLTALAYVGMGVTMARVIARGFVSAPDSGRHGRAA